MPADLPPRRRFAEPANQEQSAERRAARDFIASRRGRIPEPQNVLLHSPDVALAFERLSEALREGALPARLQEMVHLLAARHARCGHQWRNHAAKALDARLDEGAIEAIRTGTAPSNGDGLLAPYRFANALIAGRRIPDDVFDEVSRALGSRGAAELAMQCGFASAVAMLLTARLDEGSSDGPDPF